MTIGTPPDPSPGRAHTFVNDVAVEAVGGAITVLAIGWIGQVPALVGLVLGAVVASRVEPPLAAALRRMTRRGSAAATPTPAPTPLAPGEEGDVRPAPIGLVPVDPPPPAAAATGPPAAAPVAVPRARRRRPSLKSSILVTATAVVVVIAVFTAIELVRGESLVGDREATFIKNVPEVIARGVSIPDVTGRTYEEAAARLARDGFAAAQAEEFSDDVSAELVTRTSPAAGRRADEGSEVTVYVSRGPGRTIPDVAGEPTESARATLEGEGFGVAVAEEFSDDVAAGTVTRTEPSAGEEVAQGSDVTVYGSKGVAPPLPDLRIAFSGDCSLVPGGSISGEDQLTLFYRVENDGPGAQDAAVVVRATSETGEAEDRTTGLPGPGSSNFSQLTIHSGDYGTTFGVTLIVDPDRAVDEVSDDNNSTAVTVRMPASRSGQPACS